MTPEELRHGSYRTENPEEDMKPTIDTIEAVKMQAAINLGKYHDETRRWRNKKVRPREIKEGDLVLHRIPKGKSKGVRPGAAGLLIGIICSRVRDSSWMYLSSLVTIRIGVELAAVQKKLSDCVVVGFQLYSARTFHVTLSPRIYKGGQGPPPNNQHLSQYKQPHRT